MAPEKNYTADVDAILAEVTPRTKIVFLANPEQSDRHLLPFDEVKRLHAALPPHVLLVLDAAYAEYVRRNDYESGIELVATSENVVMSPHLLEDPRPRGAAARLDVRAGARGRRAQPHPRAVQRQRAGDRGRRRGDRATPRMWSVARSTTTTGSPGLTEEIGKLGLKVTPSVGNFVLIHFPETKGKTAQDADAFLTSRGCVLRAVERLPPAERAAHDRRHRRGEPARGRGARRVYGEEGVSAAPSSTASR